MNIFETFEIFLRQPLSIFRHGLVNIVHVRVENIFAKKALNADFVGDKTQITVINNEKMYNLLKAVTYRVEQRRKRIQRLGKTEKSETLLELRG